MEAAHLGAIHHGHNIKRLRDILGIKQEVIAHELKGTSNNPKLCVALRR